PPLLRFFVSLFSSLLPPPPRSTLFPYTTLFRSFDCSDADSRAARHSPRKRGTNRQGRHAGFGLEWITWRDQPPYLIQCKRIESRSEEHTSELQSRENLVCRLLLEKKKK